MAIANDDKTVQVTFDEASNPQFTFNPDIVTMRKAGKVKLERGGTGVTWTFVTGKIKSDPLRQFSINVSNSGDSLTFKNECKDTKRTPYKYTVTIQTSGGKQIPSPDPEIVNDPPGGN